MTVFDEIAEKHGHDQWMEWKERVLGAKEEIAAFASLLVAGQDEEPKSLIGSRVISTSIYK